MSNVFIVSSSTTSTDKDPRIGYENQLTSANTVTASHDTTGKDFLTDGLTTQKWAPANASPNVQFDGSFTNVDYIGVVGVNWNSAGASLVVKDGPSGNTLANISGLRDNQPAFAIITKASYSTLYFEFTASNASLEVGEIYAGESMVLPRNVSVGYKPGRWDFDDELSFSRTENNQFGPSSIKAQGSTERFQINFVPTSFMESDYSDFVRDAKGKPIFFLWNKDNSSHAIYGHWSHSAPTFTSSLFSSINIEVKGVV